MPKNYSLLPAAQVDLEEIIEYIFRDNTKAAYQTRQRFDDAFEKLAHNPYMGQKRGDLTDKQVRFWSVYRYHIIYDPESSPLMILRILSSYRDIETLFND